MTGMALLAYWYYPESQSMIVESMTSEHLPFDDIKKIAVLLLKWIKLNLRHEKRDKPCLILLMEGIVYTAVAFGLVIFKYSKLSVVNYQPGYTWLVD